MKKLIASSLVALLSVAAVAPAVGEPEAKTVLVSLDGQSVEKMQLRNAFVATWVVDNQNVLYRDDRRDYYLVTLKQACDSLEIRSKTFAFHAASPWMLRTNFSYEVRPSVGSPCDVAKIAQIDDAKAEALRDASLWRVW